MGTIMLLYLFDSCFTIEADKRVPRMTWLTSSSLIVPSKAEADKHQMQDRIEELNASIKRVLEDKSQLESKNADLAKDLQVSEDLPILQASKSTKSSDFWNCFFQYP